MLEKKVIIFDFDGVICESVDVKTEAFSEMYKNYGKSIVKKVIEHHEKNGGMSRFEKFKFYHKNFLNTEINQNEINYLAKQFSDLVLEKVVRAPLVEGVLDFIKLNQNHFSFYISTGTPKNEIDIILKKKKLTKYFKDVYGSPEKKDNHVKEILKKMNYSTKNVVFIGDAKTDYDAALNNNIKFIGRFTTDHSILNSNYLIEDFKNFNKTLKSCKLI